MAQRKESNGKWCFYGKYKHPDGTWKSYKRRGFRTKKEAKQAEADFNPYLEIQKKSLTFAELLQEYAKIQKHNLKNNTIDTNVRLCRLYVVPVFGKSYIDKITRKQIENWKIFIMQKDLKISTMNKIKSCFQAVMSYAVQMHYIDSSPCSNVTGFKEKSDKDVSDKDNFYQVQEFQEYLTHVTRLEDKRLYTFLFWTGCRISEALGLRWKDVDLFNRYFKIEWQLERRTGELIRPKTSNSIRTVDLFDGLLEMLEGMYKEAMDYPSFNDDYFVFGDIEPLKYPSVAKRHDGYSKDMNHKITLHGFRHSHASWLIEQKIDDQLIAQRLGMTVNVLRKTYAHIYDSQRDEMRTKLNSAFENSIKFSPNLVRSEKSIAQKNTVTH